MGIRELIPSRTHSGTFYGADIRHTPGSWLRVTLRKVGAVDLGISLALGSISQSTCLSGHQVGDLKRTTLTYNSTELERQKRANEHSHSVHQEGVSTMVLFDRNVK